MERKKSYVSSMEEGVRRTQEGNFAFIGEAVSLDLAIARHCKLMRSQEVIAMRGYSIAAPPGEFFFNVADLLDSDVPQFGFKRTRGREVIDLHSSAHLQILRG